MNIHRNESLSAPAFNFSTKKKNSLKNNSKNVIPIDDSLPKIKQGEGGGGFLGVITIDGQ